MCVRLLVGLALLAVAGADRARAQLPPPAGVEASPAEPKLTVWPGQTTRFRLEVEGGPLVWRWTLDGEAVSRGPQWTFEPKPADLGAHQVTVSVAGPSGVLQREWEVRVAAPRPPRIVEATPAAPAVSVAADATLRLRVRVTPASADEAVSVRWTVDGAPAGEGETLRFEPRKPGVVVARVEATGSFGAVASRDWRVTVTPRPTTTTAPALAVTPPPTLPEAPRAPLAPPEPAPEVASRRAPEPAPEVASRGTPEPAPEAASRRAPEPAGGRTAPGIDAPAVRALLDRYAAAWRARDVGELTRLGQVTSDAQAKALGTYFADAGDLEVEVDVLEIRTEGDRATVRFRRRDRFRNPAGELTTQQSPPIEKEVVRTPDGALRFGAANR